MSFVRSFIHSVVPQHVNPRRIISKHWKMTDLFDQKKGHHSSIQFTHPHFSTLLLILLTNKLTVLLSSFRLSGRIERYPSIRFVHLISYQFFHAKTIRFFVLFSGIFCFLKDNDIYGQCLWLDYNFWTL